MARGEDLLAACRVPPAGEVLPCQGVGDDLLVRSGSRGELQSQKGPRCPDYPVRTLMRKSHLAGGFNSAASGQECSEADDR